MWFFMSIFEENAKFKPSPRSQPLVYAPTPTFISANKSRGLIQGFTVCDCVEANIVEQELRRQKTQLKSQ